MTRVIPVTNCFYKHTRFPDTLACLSCYLLPLLFGNLLNIRKFCLIDKGWSRPIGARLGKGSGGSVVCLLVSRLDKDLDNETDDRTGRKIGRYKHHEDTKLPRKSKKKLCDLVLF